MVKSSTLIYLVDDINLPSDMILSHYHDPFINDGEIHSILTALEIDPGEDLVKRVMQRLEQN